MDTSWLGCMFSMRSFTALPSLPHAQDFRDACLLTPLQTTTLQPISNVTVSKRRQIIPAMVFMTLSFSVLALYRET